MNRFRTSIPSKRVLISVDSLKQSKTKLIEVVVKLSKEMNYNSESILLRIELESKWEDKIKILREYFQYLITD